MPEQKLKEQVKMKKYPKTIYVIREEEGTENEFLNVLKDPMQVDLEDNQYREVVEYVQTKRRIIVEKKVMLRKVIGSKK